MDKTEGWKENVWWISWSVFTLLQVILVFFLYNPDGLKALFYLGWIILTFGFLIGSMGVSTLKKMGGVPKEKNLFPIWSRNHHYGGQRSLQHCSTSTISVLDVFQSCNNPHHPTLVDLDYWHCSDGNDLPASTTG